MTTRTTTAIGKAWQGITTLTGAQMLRAAWEDLDGLTRLKRKITGRHKETKRGALDALASLRQLEKKDLDPIAPLEETLTSLILEYEDTRQAQRLADVSNALKGVSEASLVRLEDSQRRPKGWYRREPARVVIEDEGAFLQGVVEGAVDPAFAQPNMKTLQSAADEAGSLWTPLPGTRLVTEPRLEFRNRKNGDDDAA